MQKFRQKSVNKDKEVEFDFSKLSFFELCNHLFKITKFSSASVIAVYDVDRQKFIFCSYSIQKIFGYKPEYFIDQDLLPFYHLIDSREVMCIKNRINKYIKDKNEVNKSTLKLRYNFRNFYNKWCYIKHEIRLVVYNNHSLALNYLFDLSEKEAVNDFFGIRNFNLAKLHITDYDLTCREREVLRLIAHGFSSKEIAQKLYISNHTVISHRKNLLIKFKAKNTAHLINKTSELIRL